MNLGRALTLAELAALAALAVGAFYLVRYLSDLLKSADSRVNQWIGQAPNGVQVTGVDANGDPVGNVVPYPEPKTMAELIANQAACGVTRPCDGTGFAS